MNPFLQRALELALKAEGQTAPNPMVGAVLVKNGKIVGEGYHKKSGTPHAEVHALKQAGKKAKAATLYVTLEPCCHQGQTGPCTEALIKAGVARVVIGCKDPNPLMAGNGLKQLKAAGIKVELNTEKTAFEDLIRGFRSRILNGRPFVVGKIAQSLDGAIATSSGESKWITNEESRKYTHQLRKRADVIIVGSNTVRRDNPRLTVRLGKKEIFKPVIVLDSTLNLLPNFQIFDREKDLLIFATTKAASLQRRHEFEQLGHTVWVLPASKSGHVDLNALAEHMGKAGWNEAFVEGGAQLMTAFLQEKLIDKLSVGIAPILLGEKALKSVGDLGIRDLHQAIRLQNVKQLNFGDDLWVEGDLK